MDVEYTFDPIARQPLVRLGAAERIGE